jgi:restriction system protein
MPGTYLDAAYTILEKSGAPLHYEEITQRALAAGLIAPTGRNPVSVMASRLYVDTKGENSRFVREGRGLFALAKERPGDIADQVDAINQGTRTRLRELLHSMPPDRFEALIMELLLQMGFDENTAQVTPYGNDGGIDVQGVYRAAGLTEVNAAVQVKRWKSNVQAPTVTSVRGSLQVHQQGIIITTSDFSAGARKEASASGKTRIGLINGDELLDLLIRHKVGVRERPFVVTALDDEWWGELLNPVPLPPVPPPPIEQSGLLRLDQIVPEAMSGSKPVRFILAGDAYPVQGWIDVLKQVCVVLAARQGQAFVEQLPELHGSKRPYFSTDPDPLRKPLWMPELSLWIETNIGAKGIVRLLWRTLDAGGVPMEAMSIETAGFAEKSSL